MSKAAVGLGWALGLVIAFTYGYGLARLCRRTRELERACRQRDPSELFTMVGDLQRQLKHILTAAGLALSVAVLCAATLTYAVSTCGEQPFGAAMKVCEKAEGLPVQWWSRDFVVAIGLYLSFLLGAAYLPAAFALDRSASAAMKVVHPMPPVGSPEWKAWQDHGATLSRHLTVELDVFRALKDAAPVFGPVLSALLASVGLK